MVQILAHSVYVYNHERGPTCTQHEKKNAFCGWSAAKA